MTVPYHLREEEAQRERMNPTLALHLRRCAPCAQVGGRAQHGLCTDPAGDRGHCSCYAESPIHRLQHEQWGGDDHHDDPEWDGGLGSRRTVDRWEQEAHIQEDA